MEVPALEKDWKELRDSDAVVLAEMQDISDLPEGGVGRSSLRGPWQIYLKGKDDASTFCESVKQVTVEYERDGALHSAVLNAKACLAIAAKPLPKARPLNPETSGTRP